MTHVLLATALLSIALGALSGFAVLAAVDYPAMLRAIGVINPMRLRQAHLDWIIMGTMMAVTALAVPQLPGWVAALVMFGGVINPLTFVPMAFSNKVHSTKGFQLVSFVSFVSLTTGLIAAAVVFIGD
ncbi:hypothetical protein DM813_17995 [Pseudomonas alkylphenolica]|uniref:Hydroxylaminobenzene mutase n=1 Tax=Pseudomonas alkylphenolica TaxID=237609 RepID=A0A443ZPS4_9PSED|nr:hypothetical protein [Pseudomonas alkylphenolica]RWU21096.1 hypothetical protein DM813_17995 [Pseudomonas alkylphenolica]